MNVKELTSGKSNIGMYVVIMLLLIGGIAVGSVYLAGGSPEIYDGIKKYITEFFASFTENKNNLAIFKNSFIHSMTEVAIIFVMGFFRLGCIGTGVILIRRGFVTGFAAASFFKLYGLKGALVMLASMPTIIITIPALMIYSFISIRFSLEKNKKQKKIIFFYIFFLFLIVSIFCIASLAEGFLTTTFMSWVSPNLV